MSIIFSVTKGYKNRMVPLCVLTFLWKNTFVMNSDFRNILLRFALLEAFILEILCFIMVYLLFPENR